MIGYKSRPQQHLTAMDSLPPSSRNDRDDETGEIILPPNIIPGSDSVLASDVIERRFMLITPDLEKQVDIQMGLVENWAAFRVHKPLSDLLLAGRSMDDIDRSVLRDEYILPAYVEQQAAYLRESANLIGRRVPELKARLEAAEDDVAEREVQVASAAKEVKTAKKNKTYLNPQTEMGLPSWEKQLQDRKDDVDHLNDDIAKAQESSRIKDATFASIDHFLKKSTPEQINAKVDAIIVVAKKEALAEAIGFLQREPRTPESDRKIQALQSELNAYEALHPTVEHDWTKSEEAPAEPEAKPLRANTQEAIARFRRGFEASVASTALFLVRMK